MVEVCFIGRGEGRSSNISNNIEVREYFICLKFFEGVRVIRVGESDRRLYWKGKFGLDREES